MELQGTLSFLLNRFIKFTLCILALPQSVRRAAVRMALDTGNTAGIDEQLIIDSEAWEDVTMDIEMPGQEAQVDPSHEGGEYFQFIDMAQDSLSGCVHSFSGHDILLLHLQKTVKILPSQPTRKGQCPSSGMAGANAAAFRGIYEVQVCSRRSSHPSRRTGLSNSHIRGGR